MMKRIANIFVVIVSVIGIVWVWETSDAFAPYLVYLVVFFAFILFWLNANNWVKYWLFYVFCFIFIVFSNYLTYIRSELEHQLEKKE